MTPNPPIDTTTIDEFEHQLVVPELTITEDGRVIEKGHVLVGSVNHPDKDDSELYSPLIESGEVPVDYCRYVDGEYVEREPYNY